jgi:5-methylcytosine-specific restriction protein A
LVEASGIDVQPWSVGKSSGVIKTPAANPNYCYEWAFGGSGQPTALCIWHESLALRKGRILYDANVRNEAMVLERSAEDYFIFAAYRSRAKRQARRARLFDRLLQGAYRRGAAVRVVTLAGTRRREGAEEGVPSAIVDYRLLNSQPW